MFTLSGSAQANGEERESAWRLFAQASASRITPVWKIEGNVNGRFFCREVELNDGDIFVNHTDDWGVALLAVKSLTPHWSAGSEVEASRATRLNRGLGGRTALAVEWNTTPTPRRTGGSSCSITSSARAASSTRTPPSSPR